MIKSDQIVIIVFIIFAIATFIIGWLASRHRSKNSDEFYLAGRSLKWYAIALSAGATANSGFIMTTAIGLGFWQGLSALLHPLAFTFGAIIFWQIFPQKLNSLSREKKLSTISETLTYDFGKGKMAANSIISLLLICAAGFYAAAQWRAAGISVAGYIKLDINYCIIAAGLFVAGYSMFGGFRSSVWTDIFQAVIMLVMVFYFIVHVVLLYTDPAVIPTAIREKDNNLFNFFGTHSLSSLIFFVLGWAAAGFSFSVSQPQIVDRFYAALNQHQVKKAKWLYIFFVNITWMGMIIVGILLRGVTGETSFNDWEKLFSSILLNSLNPVMQGFAFVTLFAAIASTADSLLIAVANGISNDFIKPVSGKSELHPVIHRLVIFLTALATIWMAIAFVNNSVADFLMSSILLLGSTIAPAMIIKLLRWQHTFLSLIITMVIGLLTALLWKYYFGLSENLNETFVALAVALLTNKIVCRIFK